MSIKRYDFDCSLGGDGITDDDCGAWVQHADHLAAVAQARREALEEAARKVEFADLFWNTSEPKDPRVRMAAAIRALAEKEATRE